VRLFFALWPDHALRARLAALAAGLAARSRGKAVPAAKIHMTLAFLGEVPAERLAAAEHAASRVNAPAFEIALDEVGSFRAAHVAWAGSRLAHPALAAMQAALSGELRREGFELESRPFAAHVTLARRVVDPIPREDMPPLPWNVDEFVLVASDTGSGSYEVGRRWRLGPGPGPQLRRPG